MSKNLQVIALTKNELQQALDENRYWKGNGKSAISKNKVHWILDSPRLEDNDYCLVLGLADDKMVAFIHVLPDYLNIDNEKERQVYWMIEWWVAKKFINTVLGTYVFNEALRVTGKKVLIKSYAENVAGFYGKQAFTPILERKRNTIFFGLNPDVIIGKFSFTRHFKFFLKTANRMVYGIIAFFNSRKIKKSTSRLTYEYCNKLDNETWSFIKPLCNNDLILKTKDYINWHIDARQYQITPVSNKLKVKAHIRGYSYNINLYNIKICRADEIIGFISMLNFNDEIYLKYFLTTEDNFQETVDVLVEHTIKLKGSHIFTDNDKVANDIKKRFKKTFAYGVTKIALAHDELYPKIGNLKLKDQDGHVL